MSVDQLRSIPAPPAQHRWRPVSHATVLDCVATALAGVGYVIRDQRLITGRNGKRFFGTLVLATPLASGVTVTVGVENSIDKSCSIGFKAGSRVDLCSNVAFRSELLVNRKHTRQGERRFAMDIKKAIASLGQFTEAESVRIKTMMDTELDEDLADALLLRAYEQGIISTQILPRVIEEWRKPSFPEFSPRTAWSLLNAFTWALRARAVSMPQKYARQTMKLQSLLERKDNSRSSPSGAK